MSPSLLLLKLEETLYNCGERYYLRSITVLLIIRVLIDGLGIIPREPYLLTAQNPFEEVLIHKENYFQRSPLLPVIANLFSWTSPHAFRLFSLGLIVLGIYCFGLLSRKRLGNVMGLLSVMLVLAHPVTTVLISWIGTPDGISFFLIGLILYANHPLLILSICMIGAINHPVIYFVAPLLLLQRHVGRESISKLQFAACFGGLLLGTLLVNGFLNYYEITTYSRIDFILDRAPSTWIKHNLTHLPLLIFSLHNLLWIGLVASILAGYRTFPRYYRVSLSIQVLFYIVTFFSMDSTRVFSILAWAPTIHILQTTIRLLNEAGRESLSSELRRSLVAISMLALLGPHFYIWTGEIHGPAFDNFYSALINKIILR